MPVSTRFDYSFFRPTSCVLLLELSIWKAVPSKYNTPNANMADRSVVARDELHESEASEAGMCCFDSTSLEKSCFVVDLVYFISLCLRVAVSLNTTRRERAFPPFAS